MFRVKLRLICYLQYKDLITTRDDPKKDLIYMHMKIEDAVKMVISGGIVTPKIKK